jgi:UPF0716 family protein affecting phage T7 exclusion
MNQTKPPTSLLGKLLALVAGAILLILGFMFSLVLLAVFLAVALALGTWFFWKTRHVRKAMRESAAMQDPPGSGNVIEGEVVIVEEYRAGTTPVLPDDTRKP